MVGGNKEEFYNRKSKDSNLNWFQIILEQNHIESGAIYSIQLQFDDYFEKASRPNDMALFLDKFSSTNSHKKKLRLFFSPSAADIANIIINRYSGSPCTQPNKASVDLLVGSQKSWDLLFKTKYDFK